MVKSINCLATDSNLQGYKFQGYKQQSNKPNYVMGNPYHKGHEDSG